MSAPRFASAVTIPLGLLLSTTLFAQAAGPAGAAPRNLPPPLFFSEQWRQGTKVDGSIETGEVAVMQQNVTARSLELDFIGPSANEIQVTGIPDSKANPMHVWTGLCTTPCGIAFRDQRNYVDLTGLASIKWNTKV